jgi:hypothetical protein
VRQALAKRAPPRRLARPTHRKENRRQRALGLLWPSADSSSRAAVRDPARPGGDETRLPAAGRSTIADQAIATLMLRPQSQGVDGRPAGRPPSTPPAAPAGTRTAAQRTPYRTTGNSYCAVGAPGLSARIQPDGCCTPALGHQGLAALRTPEPEQPPAGRRLPAFAFRPDGQRQPVRTVDPCQRPGRRAGDTGRPRRFNTAFRCGGAPPLLITRRSGWRTLNGVGRRVRCPSRGVNTVVPRPALAVSTHVDRASVCGTFRRAVGHPLQPRARGVIVIQPPATGCRHGLGEHVRLYGRSHRPAVADPTDGNGSCPSDR